MFLKHLWMFYKKKKVQRQKEVLEDWQILRKKMDNECKEFELPVCIDENVLKWIVKTLPNSLNN